MSKPTILCVDDEHNVLLTLRTQLMRHFPDCAIEIAESGHEALTLVDELLDSGASVPLIIADQIMPGMKGDELLIQLHSRHPEILKIMLTGHTQLEDISNVVHQANLYRFIPKPWNETDLSLTVTEALRRYQQEQQIAAYQVELECANQNLEVLNTKLEAQVQMRTQQLQDQARILSLFYESSPMLKGIIELSENDILQVSHNPTAAKFWGLSPEDSSEKWVSELGFSSDQLHLWISHACQSQQQQEPVSFEYEHRFEAQTRWLLVTIQFVGIAASQRPQFSYVIQDISDRKQLNAEWQRAERISQELTLLELLVENILAGYWDWDIPGHQEYLSPGFKRMFGYEDHELPNSPETWQQLILPDDLPAVMDCFERHIQSQGKVPYYNEVRYRHKDGSIVWIICSGLVIEWDEAGQPLRMVGCHIDITHRKQIEIALRESEHRYATLAETAPVGIFRHNTVGDMVYANDRWSTITGLTIEAGLNDGWIQCIHPDWRDRFMQAWKSILEQGSHHYTESCLQTPDGALKWVYWQVQPEKDGEGNVIGYTGTLTDITDLKTLENQLRYREAQLRHFIEHTPVAVAMFDCQMNYLVASQRWLEDYNLDGQKIIGQCHYNVFPEVPDHWKAVHQRGLRGRIERNEKDSYIRPDGRQEWVRWEVRPWYEVADNIGGIIIFGEVITDRVESEIALQESEERFRQAFDHASIGMGLVALDGHWIKVNQALCDLIGYTESDLLGRTFQEITHPDDLEADLRYVQQLLAGEIPTYLMEKRYFHKQGHIVWILLSGSLVRDSQGEPLHFIAQIQDVTARKQAESQLRTNEEQLRLTLDFTGIGAWNWQPSTGDYRWNGKMAELLELPSGLDDMFQTWCDRIDPDDVDRVTANIEHALATRSAFAEEYRYQLINGQTVWHWVIGQGIYTPTGNLERVLGVVQDIDNRKRLEEDLQQSQAFLRSIYEGTEVAISVLEVMGDGNYRYVDVNPATTRLANVDPDFLHNKTIADLQPFLTPEDYASLLDCYQQCVTTGQSVQFENATTVNGQEIWWLTKVNPMINAQGIVHRLIISAIPITGRKQAELALQKREAQLQRLAGNVAGIIYQYVLHPDGTDVMTYISPKCLEIYELEVEAVLQDAGLIWALILPEDRQEAQQAVIQSAQSLERFDCEFRLRTASGRLKWLRSVAQPERQSNGDIIWDGFVVEVTDRKQAEAEIQEIQQRLMLATNSAQIGIWDFDVVENLLLWDERMYELYGVTPEPTHIVPYETWQQGVHPDDLAAAEAALQAAIVGERDFHTEFRIVLPSGQTRFIEAHALTLRNADGNAQRMIGMNWDISDRKQAEAALKKSEADLVAAQRIAHVGNWEFDLGTQIVTWSEELFQLYGQDITQWSPTYEKFKQQMPAEDWEPFEQVLNQAITKGLPYAIEHRVVRPNGDIRYALSKGEAVMTPQGQVIKLFGTTQDITSAKQAELSLQRKNQLLTAISEAQTQFITDADPALLFDKLLETLLQLTDSEYGFIGEILYDNNGQAYVDESYMKMRGHPYLKTKAITNIAWDEETQQLYNTQTGQGMEFHNMKSLFGQVIVTGQPVISNNPSLDPRRGGLPNGHPALNAFLGIPFYRGEQLVGMVGIANRPEGYTKAVVDELEPFLTTCASTIEAYRSETRRKQAEIALQQLNEELEQRVRQRTEELVRSEQDLRTIFNNVYDAIFIHDLDGTILDVNERAIELCQASREQLVSATINDLSAPDAPLDTWPRIMQQVQAGEALRVEWKSRRFNNNSTFASEVSFQPVNLGNRPVILAGVRDISDRKQAEETLQVNEERLRLALTATNQGLYDLNLITGDAIVSPEYATMLGYGPTEFHETTTTWITQLHPDDQARVARVYHAYIAEEIPNYKVEFRQRMKNGDWKWILSLGKIVAWDENGRPLRMLGTHTDISDRKQAEETLQAERLRLQLALDAAQMGTWSCMQTGELTLSNRAQEIFGFEPGSFPGNWETFTGMIYTEDHDRVTQAIAHTFATATPYEIEYRIQRQDGELCWVAVWGIIPLHLSPTEQQIVGVVTDITDRKHLEQELRQINTELENRVKERTLDLQKAMEAAKAANQAKSSFLAKMSHELRTPLNAILGFSQLLNRDVDLPEEKQKQIGIINRSGEHLLNLINDILEMSKIEAGRVILIPKNFDLFYLLRSLEDLFHLKAASKALELIIQRDATVPQYIRTDEGKLRQVLTNLLSNAIKFTQTGSVTLRVQARSGNDKNLRLHKKHTPEQGPRAQPQCFIAFEIEDTGPGIAPTEYEILFEPFMQTQIGQNSQEGTGLGLAISRQFVQLMGGDLTVDSTLGKGATFRFEIPVELEEDDIFIQKATPVVMGLAPNQPDYRILVVDDHLISSQFLTHLLQSIGFQVKQAANGQIAIDLWQQWQPHLIWMDMRMPVLDGYGATRQIRRLSTPATAPKIIALTASTFEDERNAILATGCDDMVCKPATEAVLLEKLAQHLDVQYLYADQPSSTKPKDTAISSINQLSVTALQVMPTHWIEQLQRAARIADEDLIFELLAQLPPDQAPLAEMLSHVVQELHLDQLIALTIDALNSNS